MSKRVKCPACAGVVVVPPGQSGTMSCPACQAKFRFKERPEDASPRRPPADPPDESDDWIGDEPEARRRDRDPEPAARRDRPDKTGRPRKRKKRKDASRLPVGRIAGIAGSVLGGLTAMAFFGWLFSGCGRSLDRPDSGAGSADLVVVDAPVPPLPPPKRAVVPAPKPAEEAPAPVAVAPSLWEVKADPPAKPPEPVFA